MASTTPLPTAGLVRSVGPVALIATFLGIFIGGGIFTIPAAMAAAVGGYAPLAYLGCAIAVGSVLMCFAEASSRVPTAGGPSGFVAAAFGPYWGFLTGAFNWASAVLGAAGIGAAAADALAAVVPALAGGPVRSISIAGWFLGLAALNLAGVGFASRIVTLATSIKLVPLALFVAIGLFFIVPTNLALPVPAAGADIGRAAILGIFLFTGVETSLAVAGEVRDPARTIPRAIIAALIGYAALCIAVQAVALGILGSALGASKSPLADAMATVSPALGLFLVAGAAISMLGWTAADALASPRMLYAMAHDGVLPKALARVHPRTHAPYVACFAHAAICAALAVSGSFVALTILATLVCVLVYFLGCAAALVLRRRDVAQAGTPVRIPALGGFAVVGVGSMLWVAAQSTRQEAFAIAIFLAAVSLLYRFRRAPDS